MYFSVRVLVRGSDWEFPQYVQLDVAGVHAFLWDLDVKSGSDVQLGNQMQAWVWYSPDAFNVSDWANLADLCGYMTCGVHGICNEGICVCQPGVFGLIFYSSIISNVLSVIMHFNNSTRRKV